MAGRSGKRRKVDIGDTTGDLAATAGPAPAPTGEDDSITGSRRRLCNLLEFWRDCETKACKRRRACMGDADACAIYWMRRVPQRFKVWFQHALRRSADGASPEKASRLADADLASYDAAMDATPLAERPPGWDWGRETIPPPLEANPPGPGAPLRRGEADEAGEAKPLPAPSMLLCRR